ncbi:hypothetical protein BH20ACI4_BH20ACI4_30100 [soil metagenome]
MQKNIDFIRAYGLCAVVIISFFCLFGTKTSIAQRTSEPFLIDEFGVLKCDELRSRIDSLLKDLIDAQNSKAYIIIYGDRKRPLSSFIQKDLLEAYIDIRRFDKDRIIFLKGNDKETTTVQFWKILGGTDVPDFKAKEWDYKLPQITKPFIIYKSTWVSEVCPNIFNLQFYSKILLGNPNSKGHIVIFGNSYNDFYQTKKEILEELINKNEVPREQLKCFYIKSKKSNVEFWFVPESKN